MSAPAATRPKVAITAWSAVSPHGLGRPAFTAGGALDAGTAPDTGDGAPAIEPVHLVPDFDVREILGRKGTRSMDRATALAVIGIRELIGDPDCDADSAVGDRVACVLGTTTGSARSMMDFTRDSLTGDRPYLVDPARFPNTVMNCPAGQCAIWHDLRGPNATIAGGRVAGLHALNYSRRLLQADRAATVLCGAVEEYSATRSWLEHHARSGAGDGPGLSEGCVVLRIDQTAEAGRRPLAEIEAIRFGSFDDDPRGAVADAVRAVLGAADVHPDQLWRTVVCGADLGAVERAGVSDAFDGVGGAGPDPVAVCDVLADGGAASSAFGIALVLADAERLASTEDRFALVVAADREGIAGAALLRLIGHAG